MFVKFQEEYISNVPDSKVHGANMGPTWVLAAPDGPHVGPMNLAIRGICPYSLVPDDKLGLLWAVDKKQLSSAQYPSRNRLLGIILPDNITGLTTERPIYENSSEDSHYHIP